MHTCISFMRVIRQIAQKHGFNLAETDPDRMGLVLTLENPPYQPLHIAVTGKNVISVSHSFIQNGDVIHDPEICFFIGYDSWVPISVCQPTLAIFIGGRYREAGGYREVAWLNKDHTAIERFSPRGMRDVASLAALWARNLRSQGWVTHSRKRQ